MSRTKPFFRWFRSIPLFSPPNFSSESVRSDHGSSTRNRVAKDSPSFRPFPSASSLVESARSENVSRFSARGRIPSLFLISFEKKSKNKNRGGWTDVERYAFNFSQWRIGKENINRREALRDNKREEHIFAAKKWVVDSRRWSTIALLFFSFPPSSFILFYTRTSSRRIASLFLFFFFILFSTIRAVQESDRVQHLSRLLVRLGL